VQNNFVAQAYPPKTRRLCALSHSLLRVRLVSAPDSQNYTPLPCRRLCRSAKQALGALGLPFDNHKKNFFSAGHFLKIFADGFGRVKKKPCPGKVMNGKFVFLGILCLGAQGVVIDQKRFRPNTRPKIIGRIFGRNKYSASTDENEKVFYCNFSFHRQFFPEKVNF
jgi:hypothetical protein